MDEGRRIVPVFRDNHSDYQLFIIIWLGQPLQISIDYLNKSIYSLKMALSNGLCKEQYGVLYYLLNALIILSSFIKTSFISS